MYSLIFALVLSSFANDSLVKPNLLWEGPSNDDAFSVLLENKLGVKVFRGKKATAHDVQVRLSENLAFLEIRNKKNNEWVALAKPTSISNVNNFVNQAIYTSSCDLVQTNINLEESTPMAKVYFNSRPIGVIQDDGRFFYKSAGVCKMSEIKILATMSKCREFLTSFIAQFNPHIYNGTVKLKCKK